MGLGDVVDEFHDEHGLSDSCSSEQSDFSSLGVGGHQVDDLDTGDQNFVTLSLFNESWGFSVDWELDLGVDWSSLVNGLSNNVHNSSQTFWSDWNHDWVSGILDGLSSNQTISSVHGNGSDSGISQVMGDLQDQSSIDSFNFEGVQDGWQGSGELDVDDGTDDLGDLSNTSNLWGILGSSSSLGRESSS